MRPWTLSTSQQPQQQLQNMPDSNLSMFDDKVIYFIEVLMLLSIKHSVCNWNMILVYQVSPGGGFGPVSDGGYGVSYMLPSDHKIFFHVASKHSSPKTSSKRFLENIFQSMEELKNLFDLDETK